MTNCFLCEFSTTRWAR